MASYSTIDPKPKKGSVTLHFRRGKTKKHYTKADERTGHPAYGKESASKDTPEFVKKAQAAKVDVAEHKGLPYRAGYTTIKKEPDTHSVSLDHKPNIPKRKPGAVETMKTRQSTAEIRQKSGSSMKRRLPRVDWLEGKNKRTESGHGR